MRNISASYNSIYQYFLYKFQSTCSDSIIYHFYVRALYLQIKIMNFIVHVQCDGHMSIHVEIL